MSPRHLVGRILAGCIVLSALVALPTGPANADYDLGVTWPDVSVINPTVTDYEITIIDSGPGDLYTRWDGGGTFEPIPHTGTITVDLPFDDTGRVEVWRCAGAGCQWAGVSSPILSVHRYLNAGLSATGARVTSPSSFSATLFAYSFDGLTTSTYDWELRDAQSDVVTSGSGSLSVGSNSFTVNVPAGLADGDYTLAATPHGSFAGGSLLAWEQAVQVTIDNTPPVITAAPGLGVFFPVVDSYRDRLPLDLVSSEEVTWEFELFDGAGASLGAASPSLAIVDGVLVASWNGELNGEVVPAGSYHLGVTATDLLGHSSTVATSTFRVDLARKKRISTVTELPAATTIYDRYVGRCSSLVKPSSHHWKDSLGLYSQTKCTSEKKNASVVIVWNAWWLPTAMRGLTSFDSVVLEAYGGAAVGHRKSYLVTGFIDKKGAFSHRAQFPAKLRWHAMGAVGRPADLQKWVRYQDGRPFVVWSSGLTVGSRYDIKSFRMRAIFDALVEPDGTLIAEPARKGTAPPVSTGRDVRPHAIGVAR